ncbi:MAG TPA: hypothetical protein VEF91_02925 [Verrucomicrobiae bacterium]|nr:hypothetical protein [Verrucomicrobiae bacterium]
MKESKKQAKIDVDRFYNDLENWIVLLATQRAYNRESLVLEEEVKQHAEVEFTLNSDALEQHKAQKKLP